MPHTAVAIIGTGFGGLGAAVRLLQAGIDDLVLFERGDEVGGVWRDNRYPGAACDVEAHLYTFAFAPNPDWSRRFAPRAEIHAYLRAVAARYGVTPRIRFRHDVREAQWDDEAACWRLDTTGGPWTAGVLVAAPGALAEPRLPDLPGLDRFGGPVLHTARWDAAFDPAGRRIAVVGTGASAIQLVPALQPAAAHLTLFQRTPPWVVPRRDRPLRRPVRALLRRVPALGRVLRLGLYGFREAGWLPFRHPWLGRQAERLARRHLRRQVPDPALRRRLTPTYRFGCKRVLLSDDYYPALTQPNVTVVDGAAVAVAPGAVVGPDGRAHAADALVFATGFHVTDVPFARHVRRADGRRLSEVWDGAPTAYLGTTVAGFPNFFLLSGPNTGLGHTSVLLMMEAQVAHVVGALTWMRDHGVATVAPRAEAQAAFVAEVDRAARGTVWTTGGCTSWYLDATGRNAALWPGTVAAFRRRVVPFDPAAYHVRPAVARPAAPAPAHV